MQRLRRLKINKFRDVEPTELHFGDHHVFLLGKNGGGKTSLLNLIVQLLRGDLRGFLDRREEVDVEMEVVWTGGATEAPEGIFEGTEVIHLRVWPETPLVLNGLGSSVPDLRRSGWEFAAKYHFREIATDVGSSVAESGAAIRFDVKVSGASGADIRVSGDPWGRTASDASAVSGGPAHGLADAEGEWSLSADQLPPVQSQFRLMLLVLPVQRLFSKLNAGSFPQFSSALAGWIIALAPLVSRIDEGRGYFDVLCGEESKDPTWPASPIIESKGARLTSHSVPGPVRRELEERWKLGSRAKLVNTGSFETFRDAIGASSVEVEPRRIETRSDGTEVFKGLDIYIRWPDGSAHPPEALSFGQKRLLAFLWYAASLESVPAITDELTNGLHVDYLRLCIEAIGDRQAFHAVQNPLLVDMAPEVETAEQIRKSFVFCSVSFEGGKRRWTWRNPTEEESEILHKALDVGIQHLSEILLNRGLW